MNMNIIYIIISTTAFFLAPKTYSLLFNNLILFGFLLQTIIFIIRRSSSNFINFYTLFFISYFFANFFYSSVLYSIDTEFFPVFRKPFNHDVINKATALAWVASSCFIFGASLVKKPITSNKNKKYLIYNHLNVTVVSFFMLLAFIMTVGRDFLSGNFVAHSITSQYMLPVMMYLFTLASIIFFRDNNYQSHKVIFYTAILLYLFLFLSIGDRGPALSLIIIIFALYSHYIKKIKPIIFLPLGFIGMFIMSLIGMGRTSEVPVGNQNILSRGFDGFEFNLDSLYYMTHDLAGISWNLYVGVDFVRVNGINWGSTFIGYILAVVPFLAGLVESAFSVKLQSSAEIFTTIGLGENATWGLGTNLIAGVYISFGLIGCIFLFFCFGVIVEKIRLTLYSKNSMSFNIIYFTLVGMAVYYPRTDLLTALKPIVWTYFIYILLRNVGLLRVRLR